MGNTNDTNLMDRAQQLCEKIVEQSGLDALLSVIEAARQQHPQGVARLVQQWQAEEGDQTESTKKISASQRLIAIGRQADLLYNQRDEAFARFRVTSRKDGESDKEHLECWPLRSGVYRTWLTHMFYLAEGKPPSTQAIEDAIHTLEGFARFEGDKQAVHLRVANDETGAIWIDLADAEWRTIRVTSNGWDIVRDPPILFRRYATALEMVEPQRGGSLELLRPYVNVKSEDSWRLVVAWIITAFFARIAHPILIVCGEQGSAKSTHMRLLAALIDPSKTPLRSEPRDKSAWVQSADHSWMVTLDNVSNLPQWLSDSLCRAVTGDADTRRKLYTDEDDVIFEFRRIVALTGIEAAAQAPDVLDRAILHPLETIPVDARRSEIELLAEFEKTRPAIFGAILDTLAGVLRELPKVEMQGAPRMADFARIGSATEKVLGWPENSFKDAYKRNIEQQHEEALAASSIGDAIRGFLRMAEKKQWEGTASELLTSLTLWQNQSGVTGRDWPRTPKTISGLLRRIAPNLRASGISVEFSRTGERRVIKLKQ